MLLFDIKDQFVSVPIWVNDVLEVLSPNPNCPLVFNPVAHNVPSCFIINVVLVLLDINLTSFLFKFFKHNNYKSIK